MTKHLFKIIALLAIVGTLSSCVSSNQGTSTSSSGTTCNTSCEFTSQGNLLDQLADAIKRAFD